MCINEIPKIICLKIERITMKMKIYNTSAEDNERKIGVAEGGEKIN
jgi:hypothetical protein